METFTYKNGRFGCNTAWIAPREDGWRVGYGYNDPWFFADESEARKCFADFCATKEAA